MARLIEYPAARWVSIPLSLGSFSTLLRNLHIRIDRKSANLEVRIAEDTISGWDCLVTPLPLREGRIIVESARESRIAIGFLIT